MRMTGISSQAASERHEESSANTPCWGQTRSFLTTSAIRSTLLWPGRPDPQQVWLHQNHNKWPSWRLKIEGHQEESDDEHEAYTLREGRRTRVLSDTRLWASESRPNRSQRLGPTNRPNDVLYEEDPRILEETEAESEK
eukprot:4360849-Pleurochrysis_carterae.AAC.1